MKNLLLSLVLVATAAVSPSEVQVSRQNDSLLISAPQLESGEKYSQCWIDTPSNRLEPERLSDNSWRIITPVNSGTAVVVVCSDAGTCELVERDFNVGEGSGPTLSAALLAALCAGAIMNLMPCVLPVLLLKLKAFGEASKRWPYVAGVMTSFMILATCSVLLGTGLSQMGFSEFRVAMVAICFTMSLSMLGLWPIPSFGVSGNIGPFGMGCLTVALGSSCAVPFLAPAMAYTLTCEPWETYLLFAALGGGFCSPFLIPGFRLPLCLRHYVSMIEVCSAVALLLVGVWLCVSLTPLQIAISLGLTAAAGFSLLIVNLKIARIWKAVIGILTTACVSWSVFLMTAVQPVVVPEQTWPTTGPRVIFVTADWCVNCSAMKATVQSDEVVRLMYDNGISEVTYLDYTDQPDYLRRFLRSNGVRDVPFCLIENDRGEVTTLNGLWRREDVNRGLEQPLVAPPMVPDPAEPTLPDPKSPEPEKQL